MKNYRYFFKWGNFGDFEKNSEYLENNFEKFWRFLEKSRNIKEIVFYTVFGKKWK